MAERIDLIAEKREDAGKGASRRLRRSVQSGRRQCIGFVADVKGSPVGSAAQSRGQGAGP